MTDQTAQRQQGEDAETADDLRGEIDVQLIEDDGSAGGPVRTTAVLVARFDPLAGHVTWSGRVDAELPLGRDVLLVTSWGAQQARTTERDAWGNTRLRGHGRPPFPVELLDGAAGPAD